MKCTGHYSRVEDDYDLDHEINHQIEILEKQVKSIDVGLTRQDSNRNKVIREMIQVLTNKLEL